MTPQMDVTLKTKGDYMLNHHFLNAVTNGIIEKLFISLSEFKYNMLCALLEAFPPDPFQIPMRFWAHIQKLMPKTCQKCVISC